MPLTLPPSVSLNGFKGGYRPSVNYASLGQADTPDAANVFYTAEEDIDKRHGCLRMYNQPLFSTSATSTGRPITGHYYYAKQGTTTAYHVVGAGDSLYNYTSATATAIAQNLLDDSDTFWSMIQIQDPRSAADDIVLAANGSDPIKAWNGSATAVNLNAFTSASQVPICSILLNHKDRAYAAGIVDATDADAAVLVKRTTFGTDGASDPHRFTESFYVGGSSKDGPIRNAKVLNDNIYFYKTNAIWRFSPSSGDVNDLQKVIDNAGLFARHSLIDIGGMHLFLSERGVMAFNGVSLQHISQEVDRELLDGSNKSQLQYAKAVYDRQRNHYILYVPQAGSDRNSIGFVYDLRPKMLIWQPPITGRRVNFISDFTAADGTTAVIYGDYRGFLYNEDIAALNDGLSTGYNGTATAGTVSTLTDTAQAFTTTGAGLNGMMVRIISGTGSGQERTIASNTATVITVETNFAQAPDTTSVYTVCGIDAHWRSPDYNFTGHDLVKLFRRLITRTREQGNINLTLYYIVDFNSLTNATSADINLLDDGFAWGVGRWNQARWGGRPNIRLSTSFRSTNTQSLVGNYLALYYYNGRANESFRLRGYDVEIQTVGKR